MPFPIRDRTPGGGGGGGGGGRGGGDLEDKVGIHWLNCLYNRSFQFVGKHTCAVEKKANKDLPKMV